MDYPITLQRYELISKLPNVYEIIISYVQAGGCFGSGLLHENRSAIAAAPAKDESMSQNILSP